MPTLPSPLTTSMAEPLVDESKRSVSAATALAEETCRRAVGVWVPIPTLAVGKTSSALAWPAYKVSGMPSPEKTEKSLP